MKISFSNTFQLALPLDFKKIERPPILKKQETFLQLATNS